MVVLTILPSFVVVFQSPSRVWLFTTPRTVAHQASMSFIISWSLLRLMSLSWWCDPTISSSVTPFSFCPQSFPPSGPFLMSQLFASRGQSIGASASVLPVNIQGWFPLGFNWLRLVAVQGTLQALLQHHKSKPSILQYLAFLMVQLSHLWLTTGKTMALTKWPLFRNSLQWRTLLSWLLGNLRQMLDSPWKRCS